MQIKAPNENLSVKCQQPIPYAERFILTPVSVSLKAQEPSRKKKHSLLWSLCQHPLSCCVCRQVCCLLALLYSKQRICMSQMCTNATELSKLKRSGLTAILNTRLLTQGKYHTLFGWINVAGHTEMKSLHTEVPSVPHSCRNSNFVLWEY